VGATKITNQYPNLIALVKGDRIGWASVILALVALLDHFGSLVLKVLIALRIPGIFSFVPFVAKRLHHSALLARIGSGRAVWWWVG